LQFKQMNIISFINRQTYIKINQQYNSAEYFIFTQQMSLFKLF